MKRECLTKRLRLKPIIVLRYFMLSYFLSLSGFFNLKQLFRFCSFAGLLFFNFCENIPVYLRLFQHSLALVLLLPGRILHPLQAGRWLVQCAILSVIDSLAGRSVHTFPASTLQGVLCHNECWRRGSWLRMMHRTIEALHHRR